MPSTNGSKQAVLYARVSTDEQARSGYSLAQQIEALREYAAREGYEVLEEVVDPGQSGASLERPGMDRVRDLVAGGSVYAVLAQDRDRFSREPAYTYLLKREFDEHGTLLRSLGDRGDDSPEGQLTDGIIDQIAKFERAKIAERSRRGKLRKAREGKVTATRKSPYGFRYNDARDGLVIYEPEMLLLTRIFRWASEGIGTTSIQRMLYDEGVLSPAGKRLWSRASMKRMILSDIYRPHTFEEVEELVSPAVAARLDPQKEYGIRWWNKTSQPSRSISEVLPDGRKRYRTKRVIKEREREDWIAIPVPTYYGLYRDLVDQAQTLVKARKAPERRGLVREWELRGMIRCPCGCSMSTHTTNTGHHTYFYYRCNKRPSVREPCKEKVVRAEKVEAAVWEFVSSLLKDPDRIRVGMEALIEKEASSRHGDPVIEARAWADTLDDCAKLRRAYQEQQAAGLMDLDELRERLGEVEQSRLIAERELDALARSQEKIESLRSDRDAMLEEMSQMLPDALDGLEPLERADLYRMLRVQVMPTEDGFDVSGAICNSIHSQS